MNNTIELTELEKQFLEKILRVVTSAIADDLVKGTRRKDEEYLDCMKTEMWNRLNLSRSDVDFVLSNPNKYFKFMGVNPNSIITLATPRISQEWERLNSEYSDGTAQWVKAYKIVQDIMKEYPVTATYKFSLPNNIMMKLRTEEATSKWIPIGIKKTGSGIGKSNLQNKVGAFLMSSLESAIEQKAADLRIDSIRQLLQSQLERIDGKYDLSISRAERNVELSVKMNSGIEYHDMWSAESDRMIEMMGRSLNNLIERDAQAKKAKKNIIDVFSELGFEVSLNISTQSFSFYYSQTHFEVTAVKGEDYNFFFLIGFGSVDSDSGKIELKNSIEKRMSLFEQMKDVLDRKLLNSKPWRLVCHYDSFDLTIAGINTVVKTNSVDLIDSIIFMTLEKERLLGELNPILNEYLGPLNVTWEVKFDGKNNPVVSVQLPGIPKIMKTLSKTLLKKDARVFSEVVLNKKRILHLD